VKQPDFEFNPPAQMSLGRVTVRLNSGKMMIGTFTADPQDLSFFTLESTHVKGIQGQRYLIPWSSVEYILLGEDLPGPANLAE